MPRSPRRAGSRGWGLKKERKRRWGQPLGDKGSFPPILWRDCHGGRLHLTTMSLRRGDCVSKRTVAILPPHPPLAGPGRREGQAPRGTPHRLCRLRRDLSSALGPAQTAARPGLHRPLLGGA